MATSSHLLLLLLLIATTLVYSAASHPSQDAQHADRIIEAMIGAGDFRGWAADFLSTVDDQFGIPLSATIFIPSGFDAADILSSSSGGGSGNANSRRLSVAYHIVPQRLSFTDLRLLQPLSRLPTLLPRNSIVITNNSVSDFTLDGVLVTEPDLFLSSSIVIHGVASPLDFSRYGVMVDGDTTVTETDRLPPWSHDLLPESNTNQSSASVSVELFSKCSFLFPLALAFFSPSRFN